MDGYICRFPCCITTFLQLFINNLAKESKQLVRHHLDLVKSPYYQVCYESDFPFGAGANPYKFELSAQKPPMNNAYEELTPGKRVETQKVYMTVPETPSPDQPSDANYEIKKEHGNYIEDGPKKRQSRIKGNSKVLDDLRVKNKGSSYTEICLLAAQNFARIREVLIERSVTSALNSGFLTPWYGF
ncbi:putative Dynamin superfamily [Helianthus annuus]|nr:putative Dynamin superfamily [Helianthus annuus]